MAFRSGGGRVQPRTSTRARRIDLFQAPAQGKRSEEASALSYFPNIPLLTSDRKMRLYTKREHLRFFCEDVYGQLGGTLRDRQECPRLVRWAEDRGRP